MEKEAEDEIGGSLGATSDFGELKYQNQKDIVAIKKLSAHIFQKNEK
ncbi:hypothetical protein ACFFHH_22075 [Cytobacillus solani]|nr:hypothetical protein [Cytobacillus solani]USK57281.1 hypothetical protein LIS82_12785 [Cytobacillus solani]